MRITFFGAAQEVTGSRHLIETGLLRVLLDCGLVEGNRDAARARNERFRCDPEELDGVILSHAHVDHCGNLPGLYRRGFRGPVFCTRATADVAAVMLKDSARIQQEDARYLERHGGPEHPALPPLYTEDDVRGLLELFEPLDYDEWHELAPAFRLRFSDAGHILGSAICEMDIEDRGDVRRVVYTGDLGRRGLPLLRDPQPVEGCEVLISEATYGNRIHPPPEQVQNDLCRIVRETSARGGRVVIPAFSLGRTQQVLDHLKQFVEAGQLPQLPVFVDSPLSIRLTSVYERHRDVLNTEARKTLDAGGDLFDFPGLNFVASQEESIALNDRDDSFVVISAGGMCDYGRVQHHLKHSIEDDRHSIVLIGYQAAGTLGRRLVERHPQVSIFGRTYPVQANVEMLDGLSAHADAEEFRWWFEALAQEGGIGQAFLVHGEPEAAGALAGLIHDFCDEDPVIPDLNEAHDV